LPEILQSHTVLGIHFASSAKLRIGKVTPPNSSKKCTITLRTSSNVVLRQLKNERGSAVFAAHDDTSPVSCLTRRMAAMIANAAMTIRIVTRSPAMTAPRSTAMSGFV